jgi:hypothetical protein
MVHRPIRPCSEGDPQIKGAPTSRPAGHETISAHHQALSLPRPVAALLLALAARRPAGRGGRGECDNLDGKRRAGHEISN